AILFLQAEARMSINLVTGIQTCVHPICVGILQSEDIYLVNGLAAVEVYLQPIGPGVLSVISPGGGSVAGFPAPITIISAGGMRRSEERRVGKEGRGWGGRYNEKYKEEKV